MGDKLEVHLKITLDRPGLGQQLGRPVESDIAFYLLGLVGSMLTARWGEQHCAVDLESATGLDDEFVRSMSAFARRHRRALAELEAHGEVLVEEQELAHVLQVLHNAVLTPVGRGWLVTRASSAVSH